MGKDVLSKIRTNDVFKGLVRVLSDYHIEDYDVRDERPHPKLIIRHVGLEKEFEFPGTPRRRVNVKSYVAKFRRFLQDMQMEALEMEMRPQVPSKVGQVHVPMQGSLLAGLENDRLTMSSREIAQLTKSSHDNVLKTVRRLVEEGIVSGNETPYVHPQNGQTYSEFHLDYRNTMVVVSGYSPELRARIVDRWMELERGSAKPVPPALPDFTNPAEAARAWADQFERATALETTVAAQQPKIEALERIAEADGSLCITDAAKTLQIVPNVLFKWLDKNGWTYTRVGSAERRAYQTKLNAGYLEHKVKTGPRNDGTEWVSTQVRITPKGLAFLAEIFPPAVRAA